MGEAEEEGGEQVKKNPNPGKRRGEQVLRISERDWRKMLDEGGEWVLEQGIDFEGTASAAGDEARRNMTNRMGKWSLSSDAKNGTVTITVTPPQA